VLLFNQLTRLAEDNPTATFLDAQMWLYRSFGFRTTSGSNDPKTGKPVPADRTGKSLSYEMTRVQEYISRWKQYAGAVVQLGKGEEMPLSVLLQYDTPALLKQGWQKKQDAAKLAKKEAGTAKTPKTEPEASIVLRDPKLEQYLCELDRVLVACDASVQAKVHKQLSQIVATAKSAAKDVRTERRRKPRQTAKTPKTAHATN